MKVTRLTFLSATAAIALPAFAQGKNGAGKPADNMQISREKLGPTRIIDPARNDRLGYANDYYARNRVKTRCA